MPLGYGGIDYRQHAIDMGKILCDRCGESFVDAHAFSTQWRGARCRDGQLGHFAHTDANREYFEVEAQLQMEAYLRADTIASWGPRQDVRMEGRRPLTRDDLVKNAQSEAQHPYGDDAKGRYWRDALTAHDAAVLAEQQESEQRVIREHSTKKAA